MTCAGVGGPIFIFGISTVLWPLLSMTDGMSMVPQRVFLLSLAPSQVPCLAVRHGLGLGVLMPLGILVARHIKLCTAEPLVLCPHRSRFQVPGYLLGSGRLGY